MNPWERGLTRIAEKPAVVEDHIPSTFTCQGCNGTFPNDLSFDGRGVSHCAACHLTFRSMAGFDDHRTNRKPNDESHCHHNVRGADCLECKYRRCRTEAEMRKRGYEPNDKGYWRKPRPLDTIPVTTEKFTT